MKQKNRHCRPALQVAATVLLLILISTACSHRSKQQNSTASSMPHKPDSIYQPRHSAGFRISYFDTDKLVEVYNPWDSTATAQCFYISNTGKKPAAHIPVIKAPVTSWSAFSSSQVVMADRLGVLGTLTSVAEPQYISHPAIRKQIIEKKIKNIGMASEPDMEQLLASTPQFVFVSPFKDENYSRLLNASLVVVPDASYMETSPLGRVEWIVFFASFFNRENEAKKQLAQTEEAYLAAKKAVENTAKKPSVVSGYPYQDVWYLPAGQSYVATLFRDAGAAYLYAGSEGTGSLAFDFEKVFYDAHRCDFWMITVNRPQQFTSADFEAMDARYAHFEAFKNHRILCSNTHTSGYYEWGWIEPQTILKDLAKAFHPHLFPTHEPVFFTFLR